MSLAAEKKDARSALAVRQAAHAALLFFEKNQMAADALVERFSSADFDSRDRAFLCELVFGVLRWRSRLDFVFGRHLEEGKSRLAPPAREALRLGTYQLLFMDRVPPHSAVDGSVSLLGRGNMAWARGLVNAVLRKVAAGGSVPPPEGEEGGEAARLAVWESHPEWLVARWARSLGAAKAQERCRANNAEPPVVFRANTGVPGRQTLAERLAQEGVATRAGCADPDCLVFLPEESAPGVRFGDTRVWREGGFIVMDEAASLVSRFAAPREGERVLDLCAAPGGKTACLAWAVGARGSVVAADRSPRRMARLKENRDRVCAGARLLCADAARPPFGAVFDLVLVDAPCSGLGVLRRHPDARWRAREEDLEEQARRQREILRGASRAVRRGGRLVYAVCSNEPEETGEVAAAFCEPGFVPLGDGGALPPRAREFLRPDGTLWATPEAGLDGFFATGWRKEN